MSNTISPVPASHPAVSPAAPSEASLIGRFVAILTPVFAIAAGWVAGLVAQVIPGAHLDQNQIVAFMATAAVSAITAGWKWLQGWQQHEVLVAQGQDVPRKAGPPPAVPPVAAVPPVVSVNPGVTGVAVDTSG
jgi:hypothetical protein